MARQSASAAREKAAKEMPAQQRALKPADQVDHGAGRIEPATDGGGIRVRATKPCYYDDKRRRRDDVFTIRNMKEFSDKYMELVDPSTPERITTGQQELQRQHDEVLRAKHGGQEAGTGDANVIGDED
jgi:hypothetical protein